MVSHVFKLGNQRGEKSLFVSGPSLGNKTKVITISIFFYFEK